MAFHDDEKIVLDVCKGIYECSSLTELKQHRINAQPEIDRLDIELQNIASVMYQKKADAFVSALRMRLEKVMSVPHLVNWAAKYRDEVNADKRVFRMLDEFAEGMGMGIKELRRRVDIQMEVKNGNSGDGR